MPSEAHPQEPRDRGPPSLITRAGRNAQLAKAAHNSPAQDKRPRGRPRKDGSNGRPAPPPTPPAPPPRSSRKKGRSRGQAQVENEESMDAAEKEEPQKTEPKEVRAAGRRRSTSRRKPDTHPDLDLDPDPDPEPEPSQERLSPPPEPEPGTVSKSSPELPSTAEKDLTSPPPTVLLPPPSPEEPPNVCSVLPPPDLNLSPRLDPSPVEEERPSLIRSPAEQSPAPSLRCSPPVSPCLKLDDEDEDSLSPLYQRSLSEDSGGSPTPILGHAKKRRKQCAFCYRGDEPLLGLGRLVVFGPTPGYIPLHILNRRTSSDRDSDCHEHCFHDSQAPPTCSSPEQCDKSSSEFMKQLGPIGLPHDIDVQSLFDATGQCCAHLQCATWSEGVRRGEGQSLLFVDKAIDSGSIQVCAFCRHLGASLRCQETGCTRSYHMPCAAAAGACQDWNQRRILCTQHARTGSSQCRLCAGSGDSGGLLMCSCCGSCYHGSCLDPPVTPSPLSRVGWQCPQCRVCRSCSLQGDSGVLLCARCDKAYHAHCLTPPLDDAPHAAWTCKNCRTCRRCGVSSSGRWANNPFLCESCDLALPCPLCDRTPDSHTPQDYLTCSCCYRCVHVECSVQAGEGRAGSEGYICFSCKPQESEEPISQSHSPPPPTDVLQPRPPSNPDVHSADSPVQLLCSEVAQSPARSVCVPSPQHLTPPPPATEPSAAVSLSDVQPSPSQTHTDSPSSQLLHAKEIYQSPAESPADIQQEVHRSQTPSSPNLQKDLALCLEEISQSPALSSEEIHQQSATDLQQNSLLSSEDVQPNPVKSLLDFSHILPPSPSNLQIASPPPKEVFHGLTSEIHQNVMSSSDEIHPCSSTPSENIQKVSLESLEEIQQSPGSSSMDIQQSNEDSSEEIHQNQAPPSLNVQKDIAPLHQKGIQQSPTGPSESVPTSPTAPLEEIQQNPKSPLEKARHSPGAHLQEMAQSPTGPSEKITASPTASLEEIQQSSTAPSEKVPSSPTASLEEIQQNPKSPLEKARQSPGAHLQEMAHSPTGPSEKITAIPAASLEEIQESPKSFTEKIHQSPGAHFEEMVQSPTGPSEKITANPAASLEEIQESPKPFTEKIHQSPAAPFEEMVQSPTGPSEKASSNPVASVEEIQESPKSFTEKIHQSPGSHLLEMAQSPTAPSEKASSSPAVSVEEIQESPKSFTEKIHQSPVAHFEEMVQSPTGPSEKITASPAASLKGIQESPKSPTEESPAAPLDEMVLSPASPAEKVLPTLEPCLAEVLPILVPPCEDICQSDGKLSPDPQQEPPLPGDNPQDPQTSPASTPLPAEFHESPAQTPKIDNHSPAPCPEEDLGPSTVSPSSLIDSSQSPGSLNTKLQQSSASTLEDGAQSPSPITEEINHDPERLVSKLQENYPQSPSEPQQCSALSSGKACGAPEPQPGVNQDRDDSLDQKSAPSSQEFLPNPEQSPTDFNQSPNMGSEENQPSPVSSPNEIAHGSVISAAEAAEVRDGPSENADPIDFDETPSSSHTHQEEPLPYHSGSSPSPAEIQQSQTCQTSAHAQQNPSDLSPTMALKPREDQSPVQETSMSLLEQTPDQSGLVCTRKVSEPEHSPPPSSAGQEDETQLSKSFSPLIATPSQLDYSPQPGQLSPAQGGTSPQCSKQEAEPNLDQKNPVEALHISAMKQDHPPDYCRPSSAPCSPCAFPPMPRPLSLSQPASPAQLQAPAASDLGLNQHQTLEENPGSFSSTSALPIGPCVETSPPIPPVQTPESLEHISTSQEHSSLNILPSGEETKGSRSPLNSVDHSPCGGPSPCADAIEPASGSLSQLTPAESSVTCQSQSPPNDISVASEICLPVQPTSPMAPTETCSVEPEPAWDPEHEKLQQAESDPRSPENPVHSETPSFPPTDVCSIAEMDSPPASSSSPHCALIVPQDQDDQDSSCPAAATQSPPRSPANRVSLIPSDLVQKDSSPEQTAPTSISLPQAAESESPSSSPHHLEHGAITSTSLTKAPLSPSSVSPLDHLASSARPINPSAAQLDPECVPQISQTPVNTPPDPDAPKSESVVSQLGPALSDNSSQVAAQHASPVQTGPAQDNTVMPCTTLSSEASATPPSPTHNEVSPPQVASPLPPQAQYSPSHRSPIASPACDLVASETQGPDPCPENSEVIPGLHAVFPEAETCPDLLLTNAAQLKSGPASLQSAAANDNVEKKPTSSKEDFHYPAQESPEEDQGGEEAEEVQSLLRTVQARSPSEIPKDQPTDAPLSCSPTPFSPPVACSSPPPQSPLSSPPPGKDEALPPLKIRIPCAENSTKVEESTPVSQSISPIDLVSTMTEPTKDEDQSSGKPSQKEEELQADGCLGWEEPPMNEKLEVKEAKTHQSDVEEEVKPISPVLDLGSSLDMEVMKLMTSSPPPSLLHPSSPNSPAPSCRGKGRILRPPPCSSRPSDDLSIRLRQSPFSTEASPETSPARTPVTPPPLTPPSPPLMCRDSPPLFESQAPPTVLPFTPKIGMGKPAISKRKFSSGRARVKQGLWWSSRRALSPPSSSQDSMGEAGWESSKLDSPLWSSTVGRGSGFPGRRRSRGGGVGGGRGGRGRSRLRTMDGLAVTTATGFVEPFQTKEEEENSMHNTVVMFSTSDHFTLKQDMCVVCGSFGQGAEGRLLACSQCGQCYHPYCVNIKITRVILTKGWRCLECTVCEACGDASDPGRLLLCDDCDISYHTYCLDPPLHTVPKGAWKCKWCVWCVQCGSTSPGVHSDWQRNYSLCGPCCSLSCCPACQQAYAEDDLILQCQQCDRWVHATCQGLCTEDEVEVAADEGFDCSLCKAHERGTYGRAEALGPHVPHIMSKIREPDTKIYTQDGVCLTESGLSQLQSLVEPLSSPRRYRSRCKPKLKLRITNQNSVFVLQTPVHGDLSLEQEHGRGELDCDMKSDSSPERDRVLDDDLTKDLEVCDTSKKRKRKPYRPGIGGFMVRQRGGKAGPSRMKLCRKDSMEGEGMLDAEVSMETAPCAGPVMDKVKRRYRKKKGKLEEAFPSYLQEAFFGRDLLDRSRQLEKAVGGEVQGSLQTGVATGHTKVPVNGSQGLHTGLSASAMATNRKQGTLPISEEALVDLSDVLNTDPHILATGHPGQFQVERSPSPFAGLDINSMGDNPSLTSDPAGGSSRGLKVAQDEPLDAILSPELDKMVSDGAILSRLYKIPELEGKDVEEVFTAVLSPGSRSSQPDPSHHAHASAVTKLHTQAAVFPRLPLMNGLMESAPRFPMIPGGPQGDAGFRMAHPEGPGSTPAQGTAPASASASQGAECEQDGLSTAQRGMLKWEKEESLGELATVAPVLYCNTNFPHLKEQYPDWPTRVKQIAKLWRKASSQDRAPFVQKARDNRAAQRINKVQLSNDPMKHLQPSQQQQQQQTQPPPPGAFDPISMELEMSFKDPLRPRESEQEQEWKMRQQMRQKSKQLAKMEATQKLEQVKNEQRQQQQLLSSQRRPDCLSPESCSLLEHTHQSGSGNSTSPLHLPPGGRQHPNLQGGSAPADDVFLRPQAPAPSGLSSLPHSPHASSPLHQPPSSPQMFSPPSSRPSSPWDPYSKVPGTPRPQTAPTPQLQQRGNSLTSSPSHDAMNSPIPSPDSKDAPRVPGPQTGLQQSRSGMLSPSSGIRTLDTHQRTNTRGDVFKAPMPPQLQLQQEVLGSTAGGRRDPSRPADLGYSLAQPQQDLSFPSSPLSGLGSPHRSPYSQAPGTPRPDCSDPFSQQSPLSSRPSPDPYSNPQTPGTPRSHSDPSYLTTPPALRLDHYSQQPATQRPSPSHPPLEPYASNPGTPRPSDRIPRSPVNQRSSDPYCQPVGTPRPPTEPYTQQPSTPCSHKSQESFSQTAGESFLPQHGACGTSPLTLGLSTEPGAFTPTPHQRSPGKQPDSFPRTPKHLGNPDEASLNPGQDPFEQGHMTRGSSQTESKTANMMSAAPSLDGPMSVLADSEEKLRQRQRLRQLLLWQQQQKNALRQEKALQEPPAPHSWSQDNSSSAPTAAGFGRPPPPYPGTVRPCGPPTTRFPTRFPVEQQSGFTSMEDTFPRQSMPRELAVRPPDVRFGPLTGVQESLLHHPQGQAEGHPVQMRRPTDFSNIHPMMGTNMMPGLPQPFIPRPHPVQQHNMPYIELRHRAPESRLRLPFPPSATPDLKGPLINPRDPHTAMVRAGHGPLRLGDTMLGQQMVMSGGIEQLSQQHMAHSVALGQSGETAMPGPDGIEHLDGEDSAVKDLEDVEVKDLVDLNLNLDPEDGKEDLDLGPNDLHLDDFLLSGKFDLIAYAMDMVNEELDLGEPVEEKEGREKRDGSGSSKRTESHAHLPEKVKQEGEGAMKTESGSVLSAAQLPTKHLRGPAPPGGEGVETGLPGVVNKDKLEHSGRVSGSGLQPLDPPPPTGMARAPLPAGHPPVFQQQRPFTPSPHPHTNLGGTSGPAHPVPVQPHVLLTPQSQPASSTQAQTQSQNQNKARPLLLEEQPLLLQDLLDQERQEQQQQKQMQALIRQKPASEPVLPNTADFDSIPDPIMKAKMLALQGINKVMSQGSLGLNPMVINRFQQAPVAPGPEGPPQPPQVVPQDGKLNPQLVRRNPPSSGSGFVNESQRRKYEEWLGETQQLLQMQQRLLEDQISTHRKAKKALSAKQRTAKKAGRAFAEEDAAQLRYISEQQGVVQKQLEQIRKQQKDHTELIEDYKNKQQRPLPLPETPQKTLPQPLAPIPPHQGGATQSRLPNAPPGWNPGAGPPRPVGQRMPLHLPPQMRPRLPNNPQTASTMVPPLTPPTAAFTAGPRGPAGGLGGTSGDGTAPTPQVKFDDNNPFSEGFQERERRERLREQQERQRVQLMQEVERHRALQKKLEQQDLEPSGSVAKGVSSTPGGDGLTHLTFLSSEPGLDLLQSSSSSSRTTLQHQGQAGRPFPPQTGLQQGFTGERLHPGPHPAADLISGQTSEGGRDVASSLQNRQRLTALPGATAQSQRLTAATPMTPSQPQCHHFEHDSSSSSPLNPPPSSFPCAAGSPASLLQMYSDIPTEDKPTKRSRKKEGEDTAGGAKTPLSPHSDITAPPTPAVSDTSSSTPTHQAEAQFPQGFPGLAPSYELERQLSASSVAQKRAPVTGMDMQRGGLSAALLEVKQEECMEMRTCGGGVVKMEEGGGDGFSSSLQGGDRGKELLRHLLKEKASPASTPSPTRHAPPPACRQLSNDSLRSEEEEGPGSLVLRDGSGAELLKKNQRCRRPARPDKDGAPTKNKRRKKEEEEKSLHSSSDPLVTHLRQLSMLPLMEPVLRVDLSLFPPYGSSSLGKDSRLTGSFGNACLDGVTDFYSQLIYKQNNLSNPPTPPASLPPTPPPVVRQKMVNGFATTDELSRKDVSEQEVKGPLKQKGDGLQSINPPSKTVDVPASLPTPPHNNQEELRVQDSSERSSPEGFVPSSSPESVVDMEVSRYPDLSFIKLEPPSPCPSPTLPITPCAGGKGSAVKQEVKTEPNHQTPLPCSNTDLVAIAITLNPVAAQNVQGVMAAVAELLRVPVPANFQLSRAAGPEQSSLALLARVRVPLPQAAVGCRAQRPAAGSRPQCCSHCKAVLGNRLHVVQELKQDGLSKPGSSLMFCSPNCSALYSSNLQSRPTGSKPEVPELMSGTDPNLSSRAQHQYTNNMSSIAVHSLPRSFSFPPSSSPPPSFPPASAITMETQPRTDSLKVKVKLKPHPRALPPGEDSPTCRHGKKMKTCRWRRWSVSITFSRGPCAPNEEVAMPTEEEVDVLLQKLGTCLRPDSLPKDQRRCCFCHQQGDGQTDGPARLLNLDLDLWAHLNCALWSSEVYETQAGALINVELALRRGLTLRCAFCHQTGATSGCNRLRCTNTYHFTCALQAHCTFFKDKTMLCPLHKPRMVPLGGDRSSSCSPSSTPGVISDPMVLSDPYDSELRCFSVFRRVFVQRDEARQIAAIVQRGERQHTFRVGSLLFRTVGRLLPHQISTFHNETAIFPVGYHANRLYWSMRHSNRRCKYMCHIEEVGGQPLFKVKVVEKGYEDLVLTGPSPKAVWDQILEPVAQMRSSSGTLKLFPAYLKGEDLFGLTTSAVSRIIESLPGVEACERYTFRYGRNPLMEWPLAFNPSGSARSEPKPCQAKRPYLLTSVAPRCQGSVGAIVGAVPGVISLSPGESVAAAHQGRHSKAAQYRRMKAEWKSNVYLARSRIQGLGLYAARDIEKCTMVIEYIGAIIRSEVANRKERLYESQNRGVYMFRIDNDYVIDATITGGPARYINHSCAPNCITEVVNVEKENKIIISSCRRIQRGEELSYDYKFDLEDDQHKIPCHCGAVNCRKWMN